MNEPIEIKTMADFFRIFGQPQTEKEQQYNYYAALRYLSKAEWHEKDKDV